MIIRDWWPLCDYHIIKHALPGASEETLPTVPLVHFSEIVTHIRQVLRINVI